MPTAAYIHETVLHDAPAGGESPVIRPQHAFNELLASWNIDIPPAGGFCVEIRVGRDDGWSPWLHVGDWGSAPPATQRVTAFPLGRVDVDIFRSAERFDRFQHRVLASGGDFRISRFAVCTSRRLDAPASPAPRPAAPAALRLAVPFRSQKVDSPELSGRLCSPTSLAMLLAYHGVDRPTMDVANLCHDPTHAIYGNWPRNIQAAYSLGVPGYLTRVANWDEVERFIAAGRPLIASIKVPNPGDLAGAPYNTSDGHLLVICGFDAAGDIEVNDPAAADASQGMRTYRRRDVERAWFGGSGGVTYVLGE
jgi:Peptidase_C39 like family